MPNWCSNNFYIYGKDKAKVLKFYLDMVNATSDHPNFIPMDNSWATKWVGNLFLGAGFDPREVADGRDLQCRGCVYGINLIGDCEGVEIDDETAWEPNNESMQRLVDKYPGLDMVFIAEEPNTGLYVNSDTAGIRYKTRYRFYYTKDGDDYEEEYFDDIESAAKTIANILSITVDAATLAIQTDTLETKYKDSFTAKYGDDADYWFDIFSKS